jgi:hypothetical protein
MEARVLNSRVLIAVIIVGSVFLVTAGAAIAAGSTSEGVAAGGGKDAARAATILHTDPVTGQLMIAECISRTFDGVTATDVLALRSEGYGFGEVVKAYFLAQAGGLSVDEILAMRELEVGWGEIIQSLEDLPPDFSNRDLSLGQIISRTATVKAERLAERLGADAGDIALLLDQGVSRGTIMVAYKLAAELEGVTPEKLVEDRLSGLSWGQIKRNATTAVTSLGSTQGKPEHGGRPDHAGPPDDKGRPDHAGPKKDNGRSKK